MNLIIVSMAAAAISTTVGLSSLFAPIRVLLEPVPVLGKLSRCPYCLNHWLAVPAAYILGVDSVICAAVNVFAIVTMSSIFGYVLLKYLDLLEE